jgi:hypothetical protein
MVLLYTIPSNPDGDAVPLAGYPVEGYRYVGVAWDHEPWITTIVAQEVPWSDRTFFFAESPDPAGSEFIDTPNAAPWFFVGPYEGPASDVSLICHSNSCKGDVGLEAVGTNTWHLLLEITKQSAPWLEAHVMYTDSTQQVQLRASCPDGPVVVAEGFVLR